MAIKLKNASVDPVIGKTATGRDEKEASREFLEKTQNVKHLVTREEINARIKSERQKQQQTQQAQ